LKNSIEFNLDIIIEEYSNYIYKIIDNIVGNTLSYQDKEEIISDTFYLLWKNQDKIKTNLKSYLGAIARNCAYNKLRTNKPLNTLNEEITIIYTEDFDEIITLKEKLKKLNSNELAIFNLYYVKGLKIKEISKYLLETNSNIKIKLYRIRKKLKEELSYEWNWYRKNKKND